MNMKQEEMKKIRKEIDRCQIKLHNLGKKRKKDKSEELDLQIMSVENKLIYYHIKLDLWENYGLYKFVALFSPGGEHTCATPCYLEGESHWKFSGGGIIKESDALKKGYKKTIMAKPAVCFLINFPGSEDIYIGVDVVPLEEAPTFSN